MKINDLLETIDYEDFYDCEDCEECLIDREGNVYDMDKKLIAEGVLSEAEVKRQFRRYGDNFKRQYRCMSGPKKGRIVTSPNSCGKRKDPRRVRIGKKSARMKKGQRVRKSRFTKRKTQSKRLTRMNKVLRGDT